MVNTEMHKLCCNRTWDEVKRRIESHPQEAREENHGNLPLHYALGGNASVDVIGKLLAAYPGGAQVKNTDGDLPLHWAVYKGSGDVIDMLLAAYSEGAQVKNKNGNLPLHHALINEASVDVIVKVFAEHPQATTATGWKGVCTTCTWYRVSSLFMKTNKKKKLEIFHSHSLQRAVPVAWLVHQCY